MAEEEPKPRRGGLLLLATAAVLLAQDPVLAAMVEERGRRPGPPQPRRPEQLPTGPHPSSPGEDMASPPAPADPSPRGSGDASSTPTADARTTFRLRRPGEPMEEGAHMPIPAPRRSPVVVDLPREQQRRLRQRRAAAGALNRSACPWAEQRGCPGTFAVAWQLVDGVLTERWSCSSCGWALLRTEIS